MKKIVKMLMVMGIFISTTVFGQDGQGVHFDNKPYVEGEFLVQYKDGADIREFARKAPTEWELELVELISPQMRVWTVKFNHNVVPHWQFQNWCYEQEEISLADYNYYIQMRSTIPNDASFTSQWHHNNTGQTGGTVDADIDSDLAWDITTGGLTATNDDIVVCMVEGGGGNLNHQDLDPNRWINTNEIPSNGIDDDGNGYTDDYFGWNTGTNNDNTGTGNHGTNCLGMIGAKGNNGLNVVGANWDVKLMVLNMGGSLTQANVITAYTYPLTMRQMWNNSGGTQGAFVVATSASWGIDGADPASYPLWCDFYDTLGTYGILNVGATTNNNFDVDAGGDMPTACSSPYMIGVGRTDHNDNTAGGYGQTTIELGAPGINVVTTANTNTITTTTGTSFSCPLTAGVIGLAYSIPCPDFMALVMADPQGGADLVLQALLDGTDPKSQLSTKFVTGGRLNSRNTLDQLMAVACSGTICIGPGSISTTNVNDNSADANFTPYASADETVIYWQEAGSGSWNVVSNATSPYNFTGLAGCTDYEYYLVSVCGTDTSGQSSLQTFSTTGCGTCIDAPYCANNATNATEEWIDIFQLDTYTNNSGSNGGYGDFTASSGIPMVINTPYSFTVTPAWAATLYNEYTRIWIDLDQSGSFEPGELLFDQGTADQNVQTGTLTIPPATPTGSTRLRVQMAYQGAGQTTLPGECGSFTWGEVEDYCVDIQDGCTMTITETVVDPLCNGDNNGSISIDNVTGAVGPYTYSWNTGSTSSAITGLNAGSYSVTISDASACGDTTITYALTEPAALVGTTAISNVTCNGDADGSIDLTVSGGTPPYTYAWNTGATTEDLSGLSGGTYNVTITDANGCFTSVTGVTVVEPAVLSGVFTVNNGSCASGGDASMVVSGGTSPYTYAWSNGGTGSTVSGLPAGAISVTVTDANGCTISDNGTVSIPGAATITLNSATDPTCAGFNDGTINVDVTGGTSPFTYSWSDGSTNEDALGIPAGSYTLTLTDAGGCTSTFSYTLVDPSAIDVTVNAVTDASCNGGTDGGVDVTVSGGAGSYTYSWDSGATTEDLSGVGAGSYTLTATDANGCIGIGNATVGEASAISASATTTDVITGNDGSINLTVSGGTAPYTFSWSSGQTTEDLSNLSSGGVYTVTITDANGCTTSLDVTVVSQVSIEEIILNNLQIYPNPTNGILNVVLSESIAVNITVYNSVGQTVISTNNSGDTQITLDLNSLSSGIYVLNIKTENGIELNRRVSVTK